MILKKLLNSQGLKSIKTFIKKHREIWDVVVYGSYVRGKENSKDIDFAIILSKSLGVEKKLVLAHEFKETLKKFVVPQIDAKVIDIKDFLDTNFLARQGIIAEGHLILRNKNLAELLGFQTFVIVKYSLQGLTYSQKKMFYYTLKGRRGKMGVLDDIGGELVSKSILKIPIKNIYKTENLLRMHKVNYNLEFIMSYRKE